MEMNELIIKNFELMAKKRQKEGNEWKAKAYLKAIENIKSYQKTITSGAEAVKNINGIGKSLSDKIDEIIKTGTLNDLDEMTQIDVEREKTITLFTKIERVGEETAKKWYEKGYRQISDIKKEDCNEGQWLGVKYFDELIQRIPRSEIDKCKEMLTEYLAPFGVRFRICGSYRRGASDSGDIDIIVVRKKEMDVMETILKHHLFKYQLAKGTKKYLGICLIDKIHRRIDIELVKKREYPYAMLYFTGSKEFNVKMREHASKMGYRLNEKTLLDPEGNPVKVKKEKEIFEKLNYPYVKPKKRS